jgi:hypothetical protein
MWSHFGVLGTPFFNLFAGVVQIQEPALEQARREHGLPTTIRVDQGSQFTSKELDLWAYANGITLDFSPQASRPTTRTWRASTPRCGSSCSLPSAPMNSLIVKAL